MCGQTSSQSSHGGLTSDDDRTCLVETALDNPFNAESGLHLTLNLYIERSAAISSFSSDTARSWILEMASPARELHEQTRTGHRGSSPRLAHPQRPRLRSCVTAPSITTSNACREALASPQSAERATDLLSRVAVVTSPSVRAMPSQIEAAPDTLLALAVATATEGQEMGDAEKACTSPSPRE
jgi:hypothetical protein